MDEYYPRTYHDHFSVNALASDASSNLKAPSLSYDQKPLQLALHQYTHGVQPAYGVRSGGGTQTTVENKLVVMSPTLTKMQLPEIHYQTAIGQNSCGYHNDFLHTIVAHARDPVLSNQWV
jgi:hypothetical protein